MGPTTVFCPNWACPARGQVGKGNIGVHARQDQRFSCTQCRKTFTATKGTVFYRLRTSAEVVTLVVTLLAYGCPLPAIVAACGVDERTVARWWRRAGVQGHAVQAHLVEPRVTSDRDKPMPSASKRREASAGWPSPCWCAPACGWPVR